MQLARILILSLHLLCVNVAAGAPLLCVWLEWRRNPLGAGLAAKLARWSLGGLLAGGVLGMLLGLLAWDDSYRQLWTVALAWKASWAIGELVFSAVLMGGYLAWKPREGQGTAVRIVRSLLPLVAATNLLYHFPPLFLVAQKLQQMGDVSQPLANSEFRRWMLTGETPALMVHFAFASLAVAGLLPLHVALRRLREGALSEAQYLASFGGRASLAATLAQLPVGLWTLTTLPRPAQNALLGNSVVGIVVFGLALLAALWLARELVSITMGEVERGPLIRSSVAMMVTVLLMTGSHEIARSQIIPLGSRIKQLPERAAVGWLGPVASDVARLWRLSRCQAGNRLRHAPANQASTAVAPQPPNVACREDV